MHDPLESELREVLTDRRRVVPVIGSGVSTASAGIPGWRDIIEGGLKHLENVGLAQHEQLAWIRAQLAEGNLIRAAQELKRMLGAPVGEYPHWLKKSFGVGPESVRDRSLINQLADLRTTLLATTNYDRLITLLHPDAPQAVTWLDANQMQTAIVEGNCVLHLHGVYHVPESVVLGIDNYERLVDAEAYQTVLRDLWLNRVLLFVGCSFDGLQDPDFTSLLQWASRVFRGSPYKHYALLRNRDFGSADARRFLLEYRIQVIGYGNEFSDLPRFLCAVNPHREAARAHRLLKIRELAQGVDQSDISRVGSLLQSLTDGTGEMLAEASLRSLASAVSEKRSRTTAEFRTDLEGLQMLARQMVDVPKMKEQIDLWNSNLRQTAYAGDFREIVRKANGTLFLFPQTMLSALKRRRVDIHENVLSGYCAQEIRTLESSGDGVINKDEYSVENAKRVLTSLYAILQVDPAEAFPESAKARRSGKIVLPCLLVARVNRLEVRSAAEPRELVALLPSDLDILGGEFVRLGSRTVVVAYNRERVFAWDPGETEDPFLEFSVSSAFGINHVAHRFADGKLDSADGKLDSLVLTTEGPIHRLTDLSKPVSHRPRPRGFFHRAVLLQNGTIFALPEGPFEVIEIKSQGEAISAITGQMLDEWIFEFAIHNPSLQERFKLDEQQRRDSARSRQDIKGDRKWSDITNRYQHASITRCEWRGEDYLALRVCLDFLKGDLDLVILCRLLGNRLDPAGYYECPARIIGYSVVSTKSSVLRIFAALMSKFDDKHDLLLWARGIPTVRGIVFAHEGSSMRIHDDLVGIGIQDDVSGFAFDDSGGLFRFSTADSSYEEVDRDAQSRIRAVHVLTA